MKIVFIGRGRLAYSVLSRLFEDGFDVVQVVVADMHNDVVGGSNEDFFELAGRHEAPCMVIKDINDEGVCRDICARRADYGVCVQWPRMLGRRAVETVSRGFLNFHASLLPRYRGSSCNNWAILVGEEQVGATVHLMMPDKLDNGPVVLQKEMPLDGNTKISDIVDFSIRQAPEMMAEALVGLAQGTLKPVVQDEALVLRSYSRVPADGEIDWHADAGFIARLVRAAGTPYPGAYTYLDGKRLYVMDAAPMDPGEDFVGCPGHVARLLPGGHIAVITGEGGMLEVGQVRLGDYEGVPANIIRSVKKRLGMNASLEIECLKAELDGLKKRLSALEGDK